MKNKNLLLTSLLLITFVVVTIISCKKTPFTENENNQSGNKEIMSTCCSGITTICDGTIMYFASVAAYESTIDCLENEYEDYNTTFDNTYDSITYPTIDDWNDYADSIQFNEDETLVAFERCLNFRSLRQYLDSLETEWLETYHSDSLHDPELYTTIEDETEQTLYNPNSEIAIGDTIYKFFVNGDILAIGNLDCATIKQVRVDSSYRNAKIAVYHSENEGECRVIKRTIVEDFYDGVEKKIKCVHKLSLYPWGSREVAKTKHYKRKLSGKYKRSKGNITVKMEGTMFSLFGCNEGVVFSIPEKPAYRRKVKIKHKGPSTRTIYNVENNINFSTHSGQINPGPFNIGVIKYAPLSW
jgi:hypothetical protein